MKKQRNYDKKVRNTRILLTDYLLLKGLAKMAGNSMAEELHRLIEHQLQLPLPELRVTSKPAIQVAGLKPAIQVTGKSAIPVVPVTTIATNGSKVAAFRIKQGVTNYE